MLLYVFDTIADDLVSWADPWPSFLLQKGIVQIVVSLLPVSGYHSVQFVKQDIVISFGLIMIMIYLRYLCRSSCCRQLEIVLFAFMIKRVSIESHLIPASL
jgi:hypothetical protein